MTPAPGAATSPGSARPAGPGRASTAPDREPAEVVRDAVLAAPGVVSLHGGPFGEVGTYLPGRRVSGVRLTEDEIEVHVVAALGTPVPRTSAGVVAALADLPPTTGLVGQRVHVVVEDVLDPSEASRPAPPSG